MTFSVAATVTFSMTVTFSTTVTATILDYRDYLPGGSDNKHQPSICKQTNPFNSTLISLSVDVWMNTTGCVVEKMQHLKAGIRWSAY